MSKRTPGLLLGDILLSMERIATYIGEMDQQSFASDTRTVDAVVRNLEIIGEAATRIPEEFKAGHPEPHGEGSLVSAIGSSMSTLALILG